MDTVKYPDLCLDRKLSWIPKTLRRRGGMHSCRRAIGKIWGLSPKVVIWIYETVVKPIMFYGVFLRWKEPEKATLAKELDRVERADLIGICGALRTTNL